MLIPISEYARRLSLSEDTVRRYARDGLVEAHKVGPRLWRIDEDAPLPTVPISARGSAPAKGRLR